DGRGGGDGLEDDALEGEVRVAAGFGEGERRDEGGDGGEPERDEDRGLADEDIRDGALERLGLVAPLERGEDGEDEDGGGDGLDAAGGGGGAAPDEHLDDEDEPREGAH